MYRTLALLISLLVAPLTFAQDSEIIAEVNGQKITSADLMKAAGVTVVRLEEQAYQLKRQKLDELIINALLSTEASRRGISVPALLDVEIKNQVPAVTDSDIHSFYESNKSQLRGEESVLHDQIKSYIANNRTTARREAFLSSLRSTAILSVNLPPPANTRLQVTDGSLPTRGSTTAPVTIVVFEDYLCPYCKRASNIISEVLSKYPQQVRFVHRDFPLDSLHPGARKTHEAARCAADQGKFWEYRDRLYTQSAGIAGSELVPHARSLGLNVEEFQKCLTTGAHSQEIQADLDEGNRLGIDGTPAFFVNGRPLSGAQPVTTFATMIQEEIQLTNQGLKTASNHPEQYRK